jgi:hypothetical protein
MEQKQAQTNYNITPNKTVIKTSPNYNNLLTVATRRPLALKARTRIQREFKTPTT